MSNPINNANGIPDEIETPVAEPETPAASAPAEETTVETPSEEAPTEEVETPAADAPAEEAASEEPAEGQSED